ncbi:tyrosine-type recombinase/integrase [Streptomyces sp. NPDC060001]|uniref:tyrosine-type recombinase/integrase n=1 Tax=Streptomyces sp. NPDC060001 TaxID=3347032 RepID=UPI0036817B41
MSTPNTDRTYRTQRRQFQAWCADRGVDTSPCTAETFTDYISYLIKDRRMAPSTVELAWYAIRTWQPHGHWFETATARELWDRWKMEWAASGRGKPKTVPITEDGLRAMLSTCQDDPTGLRDGCLITLAWGTAILRSELAGCTMDSVRLVEGAVRLQMPDAQTSVLVRDSRDPVTSVVRFTAGWLAHLRRNGQHDGFLFPRGDRWGNLGEKALTAQTLHRIVCERAEAAGLDTSGISFGSLRVGRATGYSTVAFSEPDVASFGRWQPPAFEVLYPSR